MFGLSVNLSYLLVVLQAGLVGLFLCLDLRHLRIRLGRLGLFHLFKQLVESPFNPFSDLEALHDELADFYYKGSGHRSL